MHFVGVDLAWGERAPSGLAVLDAEARLLQVSAAQTDDDIVTALEPYVAGPCVVAVDAPLIVTNATGSRAGEAALSADFRRFHAGAHPSNTGKPEFANGSRGGRLVRRWGLDLDPRSRRPRRALEVYPHPATVVLFGLDRILPYKHKQGRDLESLRTALLALMGHVETVVAVGHSEPWARLRAQAEQATRKSELRAVEDPVDAVVCAYVGLFAERHPDRVTIYEDPVRGYRDGYILTPSLPAEPAVVPAEPAVVPAEPAVVPAEPAVVPAEPAVVPADAVRAYADARSGLVAAGDQLTALVTALLDDAGIDYLSVSGRTKSVASFAEKARRRGPDGAPSYPDPLVTITDQIGVRVIVYVPGDVEAVADLLHDQVVVRDDRDMGRETASEGRFGYASRHLLVELDAAREGRADVEDLVGRVGQVQVRTVLQHAWAEFEHDIRYKGTVPEAHASEFDRRFTLAAGLLELADREFTAIRDRLRGVSAEPVLAPDDDPRLDPRELAVYLAGQFPEAAWSRADHYSWLSGLLLELGLTSFDEVGEVLAATDTDAIDARMGYRYPPGAVRRLDDALLAAFGARYVDLRENAHRAPALTARLERLRGGR